MKEKPPAYAIAACYFPLRTQPEEPGPKLRPCLITHVYQAKDKAAYAVRVCFGTTNLKIVQRQHLDLIIQHYGDIAQLGLNAATRFDLDLTAILPWTPKYFGCPPFGASPIVGELTESYIKDFAFKTLTRRSAG